METLAPTPSSRRGKLDDGMEGDVNVHTLFDGRVPKVGHEHLQDTDMANHQGGDDLLLQIHNHGIQALDEIAIGFTARKSARIEPQSQHHQSV